jgi:hypothetical protein
LGTDVLLSRNAVVELRSGALESVRARWQTLFRASYLPFTPAIGVEWPESTSVPTRATRELVNYGKNVDTMEEPFERVSIYPT